MGEKRDKFYKVVIFQVSLGSDSSGTSAKLPETRPYIEIQNKQLKCKRTKNFRRNTYFRIFMLPPKKKTTR